jgi:hypothetical protein
MTNQEIKVIRRALNIEGNPKDYIKNMAKAKDILNKLEAAISVTHCCTELKGKQPMTFDEWINFNKYTKKTIGYERNQILFGYEEMMQRYIGYKQSL